MKVITLKILLQSNNIYNNHFYKINNGELIPLSNTNSIFIKKRKIITDYIG